HPVAGRNSNDEKKEKPRESVSFKPPSPSSSFCLRRIFDLFDHNHDGVITFPELSQALERLGLEPDASQLEVTVQSYMKPGNEGLQYDDFEALYQSLGDACGEEDDESVSDRDESDLSEAFKVFDEDGDGYISASELQAALNKLGLAEWGEIDRVHQMICSVDQNRDGQVDFLEFKHMMQSVTVRSS
ncbi:calcium-binding protein CML42-like, partial [Aristolochia californica]|uniref:calcium-binding protein CML42-like n=1 Tax=Aristolochia californica TaxID=171875 RepID=UPI0035DD2A32